MSVRFRTTFKPDEVITGSVAEREDLRVQGLLIEETEDDKTPEGDTAPGDTAPTPPKATAKKTKE